MAVDAMMNNFPASWTRASVSFLLGSQNAGSKSGSAFEPSPQIIDGQDTAECQSRLLNVQSRGGKNARDAFDFAGCPEYVIPVGWW